MNAIVTGGAGFIGSHLSECLADIGYHVIIWDNLFRGKKENISGLLEKGHSFIDIDLAKYENIDAMSAEIVKVEPKVIFHYAAINGTQYFYDMPTKVLETNMAATYHLMLALRKAKEIKPSLSCKIIYASSSEVYGEPFNLPSKETDVTWVNIEHDRDSYAIAKLAGEFYVKLFAEEMGLTYHILRLFNVYGPRMVGTKYGQVIPEFIHRVKDGEYPLRVYGDGSHMRSFCYVDDNVDMTVRLAEAEADSGIYNVGNEDEIDIRSLGELIMKKLGKEPAFEFLPERKGDHKRRCPDISKILNVVGKRNLITLSEGVDKMLQNA